jgi:predicted MFS family arabinose efflux permease
VPLIAPIILGVLAGTPLAVWLTAHVGWLYGGLTLISAVSFLLAWRLMNQKSSSSFSFVTEIRKCLKPINTFVQNRFSR